MHAPPEGFSLFGHDLFGDPITPTRGGPLAARFEWPPFSVLSARDGNWQARKKAWLSLGIKSELGRGAGLTMSAEQVTGPGLNYYRVRRADAKSHNSGGPEGSGSAYSAARLGGGNSAAPGREAGEYAGGDPGIASGADTGSSVFDPVLTELLIRWFCPPAGAVLDPFAGGSVRGIVAGCLGRSYTGIDLSERQCAANYEQRDKIIPDYPVRWVCGDALDLVSLAPEADLVLTCPPYGDLERYSDDPRDLSTMDYWAFLAAFKRVLLRCSERLINNRFACVVVGDFRDPKTGFYRGFPADTVMAFRELGLPLYNEAVLVTAAGSLPIRAGKQFEAGRKLGKTHQNVLVFVKGDPKQATKAIAPEIVAEPERLPL